jgi:hypothetical protein
MTEAEWLACERPGPMLEFLRGRASDRQLRLFACACCRAVWGFIPEGPCRDAVEVALRYADGLATPQELAAARAAALSAAPAAGDRSAAAWAACEATNPAAWQAARSGAQEAREQVERCHPAAWRDAARDQADLLRDIAGNPFRAVARADLWAVARDYELREMADEVYAGDAPRETVEELADRLGELGCFGEVLDHLRTPVPHVRGCWAVDLIREAGRDTPPEPALPEQSDVAGLHPPPGAGISTSPVPDSATADVGASGFG